MLGELPTELVEIICAKLPVKARLRLELTCKAYLVDESYKKKQYMRKRRQVKAHFLELRRYVRLFLVRPYETATLLEFVERAVAKYLWLQRYSRRPFVDDSFDSGFEGRVPEVVEAVDRQQAVRTLMSGVMSNVLFKEIYPC